MFELLVYAVVTITVLAFSGQPSALSTPTPNPYTPTPSALTDLPIAELKALGKQHNIPGWKAWKKPETAIARLTAIAA